jgi:hypothetical protein
MKIFTNLFRLLLCALVMVPILYGAWAVFAFFLLRWVETFLIGSIPALGFLDPHLVGAMVDFAALGVVLVARRVMFPFVPPMNQWFSSAASSRSTISGFARVGFLALWAILPAAGNIFQYLLERPNADQVFGNAGPRAALCLHKDSHYSLASLDTKADFTDGAPCYPATPESAAAFQAQRRQQAEAAQNAAQKDTTHSTPETPGPAANQSPAPVPATSPKQPHANPVEKKASVISNIAGWFHPSTASASMITNRGDQADAKRDVQPPAPAGPYHIQIHNFAGAWLSLHISRSGTVQTFSLGPGESRDVVASRSSEILNYSAETNVGTILKWTKSIDPSKIGDKVDIDLRLPEGYSALYLTNSSGAPIHDIEVDGEVYAMVLPADSRTYAAGVYRSSPGTPLHICIGSPTGARYTYALTSADQDGHPEASAVIGKLN